MPQKLAALLVSEGAAAEDVVDRALIRHRLAGGCLDTALLELGALPEETLIPYLSRAAGLPGVPEAAWQTDDQKARRLFPARIAEKYAMAPFKVDSRQLWVACTYPVDLSLVDEISFMLSLYLRPHVGPEWRVRRLNQRLYATPLSDRMNRLAVRMESGDLLVEPVSDADIIQAPEPIVVPPAGAELAQRAVEEPPVPAPDALASVIQRVAEQGGVFDGRIEIAPPAPPPSPAPANGEEAERPIDLVERTAPTHWSLSEARTKLASARTAATVVTTSLRYARDFFEYAAAFVVRRDHVRGYDALGETDARRRVRSLAVPFDAASLFRTVVETRAPYLGPVPSGPLNDAALHDLGRSRPRTALLYPVAISGRPVMVLYCDNGPAPVSPRRLSDLLLFLGGLTTALEEVIRAHKRSVQAREAGWRAIEPGKAVAPERLEEELDLGDYEVAAAAEAFATPSPPPPDESRARLAVTELVDRLVESEWGSTERALLIGELQAHGAESAQALCGRFPGPLETRKSAYAEAGPVEEQGPVLAALVAIGSAATPYLMPLLADVDSDRRFYAALALGRIGDPAAFPALGEKVFDAHPRIAFAARAILQALKRRPEMEPVLQAVRSSLADSDAERVASAARALGTLRDVTAVPLLIAALEVPDERASRAAAEALTEITLQQHGASSRRWLAWWKEHQGRPRADWLLAALTHRDRDVRLAAAEELRAAAEPPVEYFADAPPEERARAAQEWASWWSKNGAQV